MFYKNSFTGSRIFHADGRTDMTKIIFAFCNFANAPKLTSPIISLSQNIYYILSRKMKTVKIGKIFVVKINITNFQTFFLIGNIQTCIIINKSEDKHKAQSSSSY
jgi:hypothetical protein